MRDRLLSAALLLERPMRWIVGRDFFISYTRRDAARYAARLARLLGERHSVYLDQLDTPQGTELPPRLVRAVRRASTLVLVGSPGALASTWVRRELSEFARTGRPVLLVDVAGALEAAPWHEPPWQGLVGVYRQPETQVALDAGEVSHEALQWVRDSFKYTRQTNRLRTAVALTLLVLGLAGLASVLVIRAARATANAAEQQAGAAVRRATDADRRAGDAARRQQEADANAGAARQAERVAKDAEAAARNLEAAARADAARQQRIALSRRLAGQSTVTIGPQPDLGLLLAVSAQEAFPTAEASRALFDGLTRYPALERLVGGTHRVVVWSMARSADGRLLATMDMSGGAWLWDAASLHPLAQLMPPSEKTGLDGLNLGSLSFSPAGDLIAVPTEDNVGLWETRSYTRVGSIEGDFVAQTAFAAARTLVVTSEEGLRFWDVSNPSTPREAREPLSIPGSAHMFAIEPKSGALIVRTDDGVVLCHVDRCNADEQAVTFEGESRNLSVAIARRESGVVVAAAIQPGGEVALFPDMLVAPGLPFRLPRGVSVGGDGEAAPMHALAFSPDGRALAIAAVGGVVVTGLEGLVGPDAAPAEPTRVLPYEAVLGSVEFVRGDRVIVAHTDGTLGIVDPRRTVAAGEMYRHTRLHERATMSKTLGAVSGDGRRVAMTLNERIEAWAVGEGETGRELASVHTGPIDGLALDTAGERLATLGPVGPGRTAALVIRSWQGRELARIPLPEQRSRGVLRELRFGGTPDDSWIFIAFSGGEVSVYGLRDPAHPQVRFTTTVPSVFRPVVVRDDGRAIAAESGKALHIRGMVPGAPLDLPSPNVVDTMAFSSDGRALRVVESVDMDRVLTTWDLTRTPAQASRAVLYFGRAAMARIGQKDDLSELRDPFFSPDGRLLIFRNEATLSIWDAVNRVSLTAFPLPSGYGDLSFSADGSRVFALDDTSLLRIAVDARALNRRACEMAGRTFSNAEAARYLDAGGQSRPCALAAATGPRSSPP